MSRQAHERKVHDGHVEEFEPHEVGVQIPHRVHPEVSQEDAIRAVASTSTVGRDESVIREYIKNQEKEDERLD
jgi:hypothetical protein